jgi:hypothetical protein
MEMLPRLSRMIVSVYWYLLFFFILYAIVSVERHKKHIAKSNLRMNETMANLTKELNGSSFRIWCGVQREEAITGRAGLRQRATSPKLAKSIEIQSY